MIKKYWWLIALAALAYWKWDVVSKILGMNKTVTPTVEPEFGPMNLPNTDTPFQTDADNNNIPDYLQA